jgi:hypothetical protein
VCLESSNSIGDARTDVNKGGDIDQVLAKVRDESDQIEDLRALQVEAKRVVCKRADRCASNCCTVEISISGGL